jgi:regulator of replication initiation timing
MECTSSVESKIAKSFGHVKKDMTMLNEAFADLHEKIQHLSLNQATLLAEVEKLRSQVGSKTTAKAKSSSKKK